MQKLWIAALSGLVLAATACKGAEAPAKLMKASLALADGTPISQAATDEYNPYVVKMPDGFLMLVFGSDRSCGGCTAGTHNIFVARSVAAYTDDAKLPAFNTPSAFTVGGTPLNSATAVSFAATKNSAQLRIYAANGGVIQYADLSPTTTPYNITALTSIPHFALARTTLLGINAAGNSLFARASAASQPFYFDPANNTGGMTKIAANTGASSIVQVASAYSGRDDAFFVLSAGSVSSASHTGQGAAHTQVNTSLTTAKVSAKAMSVLYTGTRAGELVFVSASETGSSLQDIYVLDGTNAGFMWDQQTTVPATAAAISPDWTQPAQTATRVYGQNGLFTCNVINNNNAGCVSAGATPNDKSLQRPIRPSISDAGLYVADQINNRALFYAGTSTTATRVYCQAGSFTTATFGGTPGSTTCRGQGTYGNVSSVFADSTGVYLNDIESSRILYFAGVNIDASGGSGGRVYGQAGSYTTFAVNNPALGNQGLNNPDTATSDTSGVYVSDTFNNRVLHFPGTSTTADRVYGQANFTGNTAGAGTTGLSGPRGVAIAPDGIYVSDSGNNRVLFFPGTSTTATRVYGQTNFTANGTGSTASNLNQPWGIKYFGGGIYVADYSNHRVLYFPADSGVATAVWGQQGSFTANTANNGGLSASSLNNPMGVDIDQTGMYIADNLNNRVLFFPR